MSSTSKVHAWGGECREQLCNAIAISSVSARNLQMSLQKPNSVICTEFADLRLWFCEGSPFRSAPWPFAFCSVLS